MLLARWACSFAFSFSDGVEVDVDVVVVAFVVEHVREGLGSAFGVEGAVPAQVLAHGGAIDDCGLEALLQ